MDAHIARDAVEQPLRVRENEPLREVGRCDGGDAEFQQLHELREIALRGGVELIVFLFMKPRAVVMLLQKRAVAEHIIKIHEILLC